MKSSEQTENVDPSGRVFRYVVKVPYSHETFVVRTEHEYETGTMLVVPTRYGNDMAKIIGACTDQYAGDEYDVVRAAGDVDLSRYRDNRQRAREARHNVRKRIERHKLDMKVVQTHYVLDEAKLLIFFTAEHRVDFRELVRDLVHVFHMRIELRQIGVRDESRVIGGMGVCGRTLCCHGVSDKLKSASIKMAKVQNLSLNSSKISGPCGRLLCCLSYEYDHYRDEKRRFPNEGSRVHHCGTCCRVLENNVMSGMVSLGVEGGGVIRVPVQHFHRDGESWRIDVESLDDLPETV